MYCYNTLVLARGTQGRFRNASSPALTTGSRRLNRASLSQVSLVPSKIECHHKGHFFPILNVSLISQLFSLNVYSTLEVSPFE